MNAPPRPPRPPGTQEPNPSRTCHQRERPNEMPDAPRPPVHVDGYHVDGARPELAARTCFPFLHASPRSLTLIASRSHPSLSSSAAQEAVSAQCDLLELLIALAPSLTLEHVSLLWRAVKPLLTHAQPPLQKKAYKTVCALAEHHASFVRERLPEWREAMEAALADTHSTCRHARRNQRTSGARRHMCARLAPRAVQAQAASLRRRAGCAPAPV